MLIYWLLMGSLLVIIWLSFGNHMGFIRGFNGFLILIDTLLLIYSLLLLGILIGNLMVIIW